MRKHLSIFRKKGFTLVEIILAFAIGSIILVTAIGLIGTTFKGYSYANKEYDLQMDLRNNMKGIYNALKGATQVHLVGKEVYDSEQNTSPDYFKKLDEDFNYIGLNKDVENGDKLINVIYNPKKKEWISSPITSSEKTVELKNSGVYQGRIKYIIDFYKDVDGNPDPNYLEKIAKKILTVRLEAKLYVGEKENEVLEKTKVLVQDIELSNANQIMISKHFSGNISNISGLAYNDEVFKPGKGGAKANVVLLIDRSWTMGLNVDGETPNPQSTNINKYRAKNTLEIGVVTNFIEDLSKVAEKGDVALYFVPFGQDLEYLNWDKRERTGGDADADNTKGYKANYSYKGKDFSNSSSGDTRNIFSLDPVCGPYTLKKDDILSPEQYKNKYKFDFPSLYNIYKVDGKITSATAAKSFIGSSNYFCLGGKLDEGKNIDGNAASGRNTKNTGMAILAGLEILKKEASNSSGNVKNYLVLLTDQDPNIYAIRSDWMSKTGVDLANNPISKMTQYLIKGNSIHSINSNIPDFQFREGSPSGKGDKHAKYYNDFFINGDKFGNPTGYWIYSNFTVDGEKGQPGSMVKISTITETTSEGSGGSTTSPTDDKMVVKGGTYGVKSLTTNKYKYATYREAATLTTQNNKNINSNDQILLDEQNYILQETEESVGYKNIKIKAPIMDQNGNYKREIFNLTDAQGNIKQSELQLVGNSFQLNFWRGKYIGTKSLISYNDFKGYLVQGDKKYPESTFANDSVNITGESPNIKISLKTSVDKWGLINDATAASCDNYILKTGDMVFFNNDGVISRVNENYGTPVYNIFNNNVENNYFYSIAITKGSATTPTTPTTPVTTIKTSNPDYIKNANYYKEYLYTSVRSALYVAAVTDANNNTPRFKNLISYAYITAFNSKNDQINRLGLNNKEIYSGIPTVYGAFKNGGVLTNSENVKFTQAMSVDDLQVSFDDIVNQIELDMAIYDGPKKLKD